MTTDFRALCVELTDCLEKSDWPHRYKVVFQQWMDIAHAALAEPDGPAVPQGREPASVVAEPSDAELVGKLVEAANGAAAMGWDQPAQRILRAAELLQRQVPVSVSERLPGPEDCDSHGWCWVLYGAHSTWTLEPPCGQDGMPAGWTHWLPAHALPVPERFRSVSGTTAAGDAAAGPGAARAGQRPRAGRKELDK